MGCCNRHTAPILQNGCRVYAPIPVCTCALVLSVFYSAGTFKVALDAAVSRIACASSDHAIRIIDWYSGQVSATIDLNCNCDACLQFWGSCVCVCTLFCWFFLAMVLIALCVQVITEGFGHGEPATSLCFSHDNGRLVTVSGSVSNFVFPLFLFGIV